jgi:putative proteasome-type protease
MTYCIGINVNEGMIFASDSRTNAGLNDINKYSKMFNYAVGDRNLVIVTSGNLATSQAVFSAIKKDLESTSPKKKLKHMQHD